MSLGILNKRNKMKWDNAFDPTGGNSFLLGETSSDKATVVGHVNGQEIREKIMTKVIGETQITANHAAFKIEPDNVQFIPIEISGAVLPENAPLSADNVPCYFDGAGSTTSSLTFSATNTVRSRVVTGNYVWIQWGSGNTTIKEGTLIYVKVKYIVLSEGVGE